MNNLNLAKMYAVLVGTLGVLGLFVAGHLFELTNSDLLLDVARLGLAAYLAYAAFVSKKDSVVNSALMVTGVAYLGLALLALITPTLGGLLPSGLTGFDVVFHLLTGALATYVAARRSTNSRAVHA